MDRPDENDAFVSDSRGGYGVSVGHEHVGTYLDMDAAIEQLCSWMNNSKFYPNVWYVNDHGNITLLSMNADTGEWEFTDTAYV